MGGADETRIDLFSMTQPIRGRRWLGYLLAILLSLAAVAMRLALGDLLLTSPYLTFVPAVLVASLLGGFGPGILAAILSGFGAVYFVAEPRGSFALTWPDGWLGFASYGFVAVTIVVLVGAMIRAYGALAASDRDRRLLNATLEARVVERTAELTDRTNRLIEEATAREAAEATIRQMQKMEAIGQLSGGVAHDFNNMLAIIIGNLDIARRRLGAGNADVVRQLDNAMDGARRGAELTQRLLAFARRQPLAPAVTDAGKLVANMSELLRRTLGETIETECVLAGGLWRTFVDPGQLENAILNLALNARDAMPGGGKLTIETQNAFLDDAYAAVHAEVTAGQYVLISVSDAGAGMSPEVAARAIEPFYTTKEIGKGTGLGLSQVFGFVKQSGGHLKIYSEPRHGTTVKIYLPRHVGAAAEEGPTVAAEPAMPAGRADEIILVVEDEESVRRTSVDALRELGYTVRHAADGAAALRLLEGQPGVRLLFTDIVMPGMNGRQLADEAKRRRPDIRVLYTTGYTQNAVVHHGTVDPGVALLAKPFAVDQLARKVRAVLDGSGANRTP